MAYGEPVQPTRQTVDVDLDHASGGGHAGEATERVAGDRRPWGSGRVGRVTVQVPPAGYQRLEAARVLATIERLQRRIAARFPERGLCRVAGELVTVAAQVADSASSSRLRLRRIRVLSRVLSVVILVATLVALLLALGDALTNGPARSFEWLPLIETAINDLVYAAIAIFFLWSFPERLAAQPAARPAAPAPVDRPRHRHAPADQGPRAAQAELRATSIEEHQARHDPGPGGALPRLLLGDAQPGRQDRGPVRRGVARTRSILETVARSRPSPSGMSRKIWQKISLLPESDA